MARGGSRTNGRSAAPPAAAVARGAADSGRRSLVDGAEQALRDWLAPGRYRTGDRLPPENEVAAMLGISRGTLRSALRRLEESGEIVRRQGSGTFVGRMAVSTRFDERLERLEPYSSVAARRGLTLSAREITIERRAVGGDAAGALGLAPTAETTVVCRTLLADGAPIAVMFDVVHPQIALDHAALRTALEQGQMVLDVLIEAGIPVTYARTRVMPALISARERVGKQLGVRGTTAGLEMEELIFAGRDDCVAYSRDLFAPGGVEVMVMRSLEAPTPARIAGKRAGKRRTTPPANGRSAAPRKRRTARAADR